MDADSVLTHLQSLLATAAHADTIVRVLGRDGQALPNASFPCHRAMLTQASFFAALTHSQWAVPASSSQRTDVDASGYRSDSSPVGDGHRDDDRVDVLPPSPEGGSRLSRAAADGADALASAVPRSRIDTDGKTGLPSKWSSSGDGTAASKRQSVAAGLGLGGAGVMARSSVQAAGTNLKAEQLTVEALQIDVDTSDDEW